MDSFRITYSGGKWKLIKDGKKNAVKSSKQKEDITKYLIDKYDELDRELVKVIFETEDGSPEAERYYQIRSPGGIAPYSQDDLFSK